MNRASMKRATVAVLAVAMLVAAWPSSFAAGRARPQSAEDGLVLRLDAEHSEVHWVLDTSLHTVHGTFSLKGGSLHIDPATGKAAGEIVVLAASGKSGNDGRDRKMHKDVLESAKFAEIVFHPDHVEGRLSPTGAQDLQLRGRFQLHGSEHEMSMPVHAELNGDSWSGTTRFRIPFVSWGLKDPSNFFLKTKKEVEVDLELKGKIQK